jgi:DNA primase
LIAPKTTQLILETARIEEVVGDFVSLRRRGVNLIGLCPFHGERTPSFNVNPPRNLFKCFGCGKAGDSVTFLREHENLTFEEALRWLARRYNIEIEEIQRTPEQIAAFQLEDSLYVVNDFAQKHFAEQLFDTDEGQSVALTYFRERGLRDDTIRTFGLGYAPDQRDLMLRRAQTAGFTTDLLQQLGLCNQEGNRDFFRSRVMFTIHNQSGKVAAFAGRIISSPTAPKSDKTGPKYINSPETAIYVKNKLLYGAFQARTAIRKQDECILVEGYMDVIALWQSGIQNVVASSGTSLTEGQLQLIKRNTSNLTILYDGDAAGVKAALRGLDLALEQDLNVRIVLLPDGHDPDSYVNQFGAETLQEHIKKEGKDFILFKTSLLLDETQGDPVKRAGLVRDIVSSIAKMPDPIKRSVYLRECSGLLQVSEEALISETNKLLTTQIKKKADKAAMAGSTASDSDSWNGDSGFPTQEFYDAPPDAGVLPEKRQKNTVSDEFQERDIIRLLVQFGTTPTKDDNTVANFILTDLEELLGNFDNPLYGRIAAECDQLLRQGQNFDQHFFIHHPANEVRELAIDLLTAPWEYSPNWEAMKNMPLQNQPMPERNFDADTAYAVDMFKWRKLKKMCEITNPNRIKEAVAANDHELLMQYMRVQQKIKAAHDALAAKRNITVVPK